ncbi:hypothetical protein B5M42_021425 [Paenibacillus athensensis]|uniref:Histidine kinase/HSP90-like ATPase domain-containing protein n=1 Tax=Paenibacillus athensensis TaxID=1967502 RepID=A0A4Y8PZQ5_9BACL|nr:ATP-binding protein [Paenibacillus athensensis]MCD1261366.1 hypothetical protein [Paenibacillus athensensis]
MKNKSLTGIGISILCMALVWCIYITCKFPYVGLDLEFNQDKQWVVKYVDTQGVSVQLDIKAGDMIKQVDGVNPSEFPSVIKWRTIEQAHSLTVLRNGFEHEITFDKENPAMDVWLPLLEGAFSLIIGILLFMKMRLSPSARQLSLFFLAGAVIWFSFGASIRGDTTGKVLIGGFMTAFSVMFYHFLVLFFKEKVNVDLPRKVISYLYALALFISAVRLLYYAPWLASLIYPYNSFITLTFFSSGFLINLIMLALVYFKYRKDDLYLSAIIKNVWFSLLVSVLPIITLSFLPLLVTGEYFIHANLTSCFLLFFPLFSVYLIASNRLYDIGIILRRVAFAGVLAILPAGLFTAAYVIFFADRISGAQILFQFAGTLVIVTFVLYSAEYVTTKFEVLLFPRKFMLRSTLKRISKNCEGISSFRDLKNSILVDIVRTLQVMGGAIVFLYKDDIEIIYEGEIDPEEIERLMKSSALLGHPLYTSTEVNRHEEYTSYLIMTRKKSNMLLGQEERQWLNIVVSYLAVSLENVYLTRKLTTGLQQLASQLPNEQTAQEIQWFRKIMFELQEEERIRIATDLHDTTMQDLFFLKGKLIPLLDKYLMSEEDEAQLKSLIKFVEMINVSLRQSCFELDPYLLQEIGFVSMIKMYLDKERSNSPFQIDFIAQETPAIEQRDLNTKRHIFRMVQELLNNAKKHSHASRVTFTLTESHEWFCLIYEDDGVGFDKGNASPEIGMSGKGIEQLKGRILHLDGQVQLETQKGDGVRFIITIPVLKTGQDRAG